MVDVDIVSALYSRRRIKISTIIVHEDYTDSANDIALLRLGKKVRVGLLLIINAQRRKWTYQSSALSVFLASMTALLTRKDMSLVSIVY